MPQANPFSYETFAQAKQTLAQNRLNDPTNSFWTDAECGIYITEALRVWNCLTQTWLQDYTHTLATDDLTWQSTGSPSNPFVGHLLDSPRLQTLTDAYVYTVAQYHLLEPPTGNATWTGTPQFTLADFMQAFQRRRDQIIQATACYVGPFSNSFSVPPSANRVQLPDSTAQSILDLRRVRFVPAAGQGAPSTLFRDDGMAFEYFHNPFLQTNDNPLAWDVLAGPPLMLTFDDLVNVPNTLDILAILSGGPLNVPILIPAPAILNNTAVAADIGGFVRFFSVAIGDIAFFIYTGSNPPSAPSGWTIYAASSGATTNSYIISTVIDASNVNGFIPTDSGGLPPLYLFVRPGSGGIREIHFIQGTTTPQIITTSDAVVAGDLGLYFGGLFSTPNSNPNLTVNRGHLKGNGNGRHLANITVWENFTTDGAQTVEFDCPNGPFDGFYGAVIVIASETTGGTTDNLLYIPNDWYWVLKFGMMSDLLRKESESTDLERADYCERRFQEGLQLMNEMPWLTQARIDNVPCDTPSVAEMDTFSYEWQSDPDAAVVIVRGGIDLFAISPIIPPPNPPTVPDTDVAVTLTLVGNAPIPVADGDFVQVSRDVLDLILDEAQHLAMFKTGGFDFAESTRTLHKSFLIGALSTNARLRESGIFPTDIRQVGDSRQAAAQPRFAESSQ